MLPSEVLAIRRIGDTAYPYWKASSVNGIHLLLEPGESVLHAGSYRISQISPKAWTLPDTTTLVVTDRRTGFLTTQFDTGGGWIGLGIAGLAVAATANVVSKRRAAERSTGKVAVGHVRHEWVTEVSLRRRKALIGVVDTYVDLTVSTSTGPRVIELWSRGLAAEKFARWLVAWISAHRMPLLRPESRADIAMLNKHQQPGQAPGEDTGTPVDLRWRIPGSTPELTDSVIALLWPAPGTTANT